MADNLKYAVALLITDGMPYPEAIQSYAEALTVGILMVPGRYLDPLRLFRSISGSTSTNPSNFSSLVQNSSTVNLLSTTPPIQELTANASAIIQPPPYVDPVKIFGIPNEICFCPAENPGSLLSGVSRYDDWVFPAIVAMFFSFLLATTFLRFRSTKLRNAYERLQGEHEMVVKVHNASQNTYNTLQGEREALEGAHHTLQDNHHILQVEHEMLQGAHEAMNCDYNVLQANYERLKENHEALQQNLAVSQDWDRRLRDACKKSYYDLANLRGEHNKLQTEFSELGEQFDKYQIHCINQKVDRDELRQAVELRVATQSDLKAANEACSFMQRSLEAAEKDKIILQDQNTKLRSENYDLTVEVDQLKLHVRDNTVPLEEYEFAIETESSAQYKLTTAVQELNAEKKAHDVTREDNASLRRDLGLTQNSHANMIKATQETHTSELKTAQEDHAREIENLHGVHAATIRVIQDTRNREVDDLRMSHDGDIKNLQDAHDRKLKDLKQSHEDEIELLRKGTDSVLCRLEDANTCVTELRATEASLRQDLAAANSRDEELQHSKDKLQEDITSAGARIQELEDSKALSASNSQDLEKKSSQIQSEKMALQENLDAARNEIYEVKERFRVALEKERQVVKERIEELKGSNTALQDSLKVANEEKTELQNAKLQLQEAQTASKNDLKNANGRIERLEGDITVLKNSRTVANKERTELQNYNVQLQETQRSSKSDLEDANERIKKLEGDNAVFQDNFAAIMKDSAKVRNDKLQLQQAHTLLKADFDTANGRIETLEGHNLILKNSLAAANKKNTALDRTVVNKSDATVQCDLKDSGESSADLQCEINKLQKAYNMKVDEVNVLDQRLELWSDKAPAWPSGSKDPPERLPNLEDFLYPSIGMPPRDEEPWASMNASTYKQQSSYWKKWDSAHNGYHAKFGVRDYEQSAWGSAPHTISQEEIQHLFETRYNRKEDGARPPVKVNLPDKATYPTSSHQHVDKSRDPDDTATSGALNDVDDTHGSSDHASEANNEASEITNNEASEATDDKITEGTDHKAAEGADDKTTKGIDDKNYRNQRIHHCLFSRRVTHALYIG
ncbi:hypothetical protein N0V90_013400 [Kalmusia sp. IMI 367209]|nr:hypothetical protein N0V90_013400 [Kalmusia sp. IMI 367209]